MSHQPIAGNSEIDRSPTEFDKLSDDELDRLINATGRARVSQVVKPQSKRYIDLDALIGDR